MHALLDVHNKYSAMVQSSFSGDTGFIQALDKVSDPRWLCNGPLSSITNYDVLGVKSRHYGHGWRDTALADA